METLVNNLQWWPNLASAGVLLACVIYWLIVALGVLGPDSLDIDLDLDDDAISTGGDSDASLAGSLFGLTLLLKWLNFGRVPLMVWLTPFVGIALGLGLIVAPTALRESTAWWLSGLLAGGVAAVSLLLTKGVTQPLVPLFAETALSAEQANRQLIGQTGTVVTGTLTDRGGQVEVVTDGAPLRLQAQLESSAAPLERGDRVVIMERQPTGVAIVRAAGDQ